MNESTNTVQNYPPRSMALYVHPDIHRALKRHIALHDAGSIQQATEEAVTQWLEKQQNGEKLVR